MKSLKVKMDNDRDFIIKIIQYLENNYGIIFFITTTDFDVLYRWWEKRIPLRIVNDSIANVVKRWAGKNKKIKSFSDFRYEVKKNFESFLQLSVGNEAVDNGGEARVEKNRDEEIEHFFHHYPVELNTLRQDFENIRQEVKDKKTPDLTVIHRKLVELYSDDHELNLKTGIFLKNLSPVLRKPEIEQRYRLNYLIDRFQIPDFD